MFQENIIPKGIWNHLHTTLPLGEYHIVFIMAFDESIDAGIMAVIDNIKLEDGRCEDLCKLTVILLIMIPEIVESCMSIQMAFNLVMI